VSARSAAVTLAATLGYGLLAQYLFVRETVGVNLPVTVGAALAAALVVRPRGTRLHWRGAWFPLGAIAFAALCAVRTDVPLVVFDLIAAGVLLVGSVLVLRGVGVWDLPLLSFLAATSEAMSGSLAGGVDVFRRGAAAFAAVAPSRSSRIVAHAGGALLAVPFLVLFGTLFSSADAVFRHTLEGLVDVTELRRLYAELPARLTLALLAAWLIAGWLGQLGGRAEPAVREHRGLLAMETATTMLLAIDALFASFVVIQVAYLFGGRDTLDAAGIAYSTYGRAGFFELVAVASIVATLLFALDLAVRARGRSYVLAALALIVLTGVVLGSATLRMKLYQAAYGWSELRFYAFAAIAFIGVAFIVLAWAILRNGMRVAAQRLAVAGLAVAVVVNVIGPSSFVARRDLERVIDPSSLPDDASRDLDVAYLVSLGDGAWPALFELAPALPEPSRSAVIEALRRESQRRPALPGWQSWNADREAARSLVVRAIAEGTRFMR
jgi:hypothetical protein